MIIAFLVIQLSKLRRNPYTISYGIRFDVLPARNFVTEPISSVRTKSTSVGIAEYFSKIHLTAERN